LLASSTRGEVGPVDWAKSCRKLDATLPLEGRAREGVA
jgi:hypothetical protein